MKTALASVIAALLIATFLWLASSTTSTTARNTSLGVAILVTFLLGLGCGERARTAYNQDVSRANKLLSEQNDDLREANLVLLRQNSGLGPTSGDVEPATTRQEVHDGSEGPGGPKGQSGDVPDRKTHTTHGLGKPKLSDGGKFA